MEWLARRDSRRGAAVLNVKAHIDGRRTFAMPNVVSQTRVMIINYVVSQLG
jgi:hypothetical protein